MPWEDGGKPLARDSERSASKWWSGAPRALVRRRYGVLMPLAFVLGAWLREVPLSVISGAIGLLVGAGAAIYAGYVFLPLHFVPLVTREIFTRFPPRLAQWMRTPITLTLVLIFMVLFLVVVGLAVLIPVLLFSGPFWVSELLSKHFDIDADSFGIFALSTYVCIWTWVVVRMLEFFSRLPPEMWASNDETIRYSADDEFTPAEWNRVESPISLEKGVAMQESALNWASLFREVFWAVLLVAASLAVATFRPSWASIALFVVALPVVATYGRWSFARYLNGDQPPLAPGRETSWPTLVNSLAMRIFSAAVAVLSLLWIISLIVGMFEEGRSLRLQVGDLLFVICLCLFIAYLSKYYRRVLRSGTQAPAVVGCQQLPLFVIEDLASGAVRQPLLGDPQALESGLGASQR